MNNKYWVYVLGFARFTTKILSLERNLELVIPITFIVGVVKYGYSLPSYHLKYASGIQMK